jgi:hypothetical protein
MDVRFPSCTAGFQASIAFISRNASSDKKGRKYLTVAKEYFYKFMYDSASI